MKFNPIKQKAYKVVTVMRDGVLVSATSKVYTHATLRTTYHLDRIVRAPMGRLFIFDTLDNARNFYYDCGGINHQIWEVEAYNVTELPERMFTYDLFLEKLQLFWNEPSKRPTLGSSVRMTPEGSLGCKSLRMIRYLY